jgi:hypothetical protein
MTWLDNAIEKAGAPIIVDVRHIGLGVDAVEAIPLSANEYQVLKQHPEMRSLEGDDRVERLGLLMVCEMMAKADPSVSWSKMKHLPLHILGELSVAITEALGTATGDDGALGE